MKRRDFIKSTAGMMAAYSLSKSDLIASSSTYPDLVVVNDSTPEQLVRSAIDALGGMSRFISKGDIVVLKANMSWDRAPEQAANTNPDVVAEITRLCLNAGAKKVKVFDRTLNEPKRCYRRSGIEKAATEAGAEVSHVHERRFKNERIPEGVILKSWEIYKDVLEADKIINIPIAKHHSIGGVSLGMKNFMGFLGGRRGALHRDYPEKINDINSRIKADLTVLDAYRVLLRNGPSGGNLADVETRKMLIAGTDPVAVDSFGTSQFGLDPKNVEYLTIANKRKFGEIDLSKLNVLTQSLATK